MHSSMQYWHIAMHASSIAIMDAWSMPCIRIIPRIIVLHMSAQFMHAVAQDIICVEHTVHACSQAEQASIQACMTDMSIDCIPGIDIMSFDMASIIIESISRSFHLSYGRRCAAPSERYSAIRRSSRVSLHAQEQFTNPSHSLDGMSQNASPRRSLVRLLNAVVAAAVLTAGGLLGASPASAHDELIASDPVADTSLGALPAQLTLTFSNSIDATDGASEVQVTDAAGTTLTSGAPAVTDNVLTQPLQGAASGVVTVLWKVVSSDGHPISGQFAFTVTAPVAPTPTPTESASAAPTPTPDETVAATPTPTPGSDETASTGDALPWIIAAIVVLGVAAGVIYLLVSRSRRRRDVDALRSGTEPPPGR
jgi:methionine-rich copper-binding protein CopC